MLNYKETGTTSVVGKTNSWPRISFSWVDTILTVSIVIFTCCTFILVTSSFYTLAIQLAKDILKN